MYISTQKNYTRTNIKSRKTMKRDSKTQDGNILGEALYAYALKLTGSKYQAEELVLKTTACIKQKATTYTPALDFVTWAKMVMKSTFTNTVSAAEIKELYLLSHYGSMHPTDTNIHDKYSLKEQIYIMARLTPQQATVLTLRLHGYNHHEIARKINTTVEYTRNTLAETRQKLTRMFYN